MKTIIVGGAQLGDEGKGKLTDVLAAEADISIRCSGGANAEHTVMRNGQPLRFRVLPLGILSGNLALISPNVVLGIELLARDIRAAEALLGDLTGRLLVSPDAHLALPHHIRHSKQKNSAIGTIGQGVGPANADRKLRRGLSLGRYLRALHGDHEHDHDDVELSLSPSMREDLELIGRYVGSTNRAIAERNHRDPNTTILIEGSQGFMLDNLFGTYPYVTSACLSSAALLHGAGLPWSSVSRNIGVVKAYLSRYSRGPFVTRCAPEDERALQQHGNEVATPPDVRLIDCGWFDIVALRYAQRMNDYTELCVNKLDCLSYLDEIPICVQYRYCGEVMSDLYEWSELDTEKLEPIYEHLPGWRRDIRGVTRFDELPVAAQGYIRFIERHVGVPVRYIGTGPGREDIINRACT